MSAVASDAFTSIPVLDLSPWSSGTGAGADAFAAELLEVAHRVGFLLLAGHGVDDAVTARWIDAVASFFALPEATKAGIDKHRSPHFRGWERVGAELTDNRVDHREQLDLCTEHDPVVPADPVFLRLEGPNQWLAEEALPGFRAVVEDWLARMGGIAEALMAALSRGLGLDDGFLHRAFGERPFSLAKLIRYPATPEGECGVNAHHDAGFLTILLQHGTSGLQALNPGGDWIDVPPTPGTFVINLGEMLQAMTGNYLVATTHRVIAGSERYSSAYFHGPDLRTPLDPLPLDPRFAAAVAASPRHASAGFMARRQDLLAGRRGTGADSPDVYGRQLWNYYARSYPEVMAVHHGDLGDAAAG